MTRARDVSSRNGLTLVIPTSVAVGSGSGSVSANGAVTFSGVSSLSLNGCFTSAYDSYRVVLANFTFTNAGISDTYWRMRASGTDAAGATDYAVHYARVYTTGTSANAGSNGQSVGSLAYKSTGGYGSITMDISHPAQAAPTINLFSTLNYQSDIAGYIWASGGNVHKLSNSYDGMTFLPALGSMSGTMRIYGYNNG
jgi:hypothetical protein